MWLWLNKRRLRLKWNDKNFLGIVICDRWQFFMHRHHIEASLRNGGRLRGSDHFLISYSLWSGYRRRAMHGLWWATKLLAQQINFFIPSKKLYWFRRHWQPDQDLLNWSLGCCLKARSDWIFADQVEQEHAQWQHFAILDVRSRSVDRLLVSLKWKIKRDIWRFFACKHVDLLGRVAHHSQSKSVWPDGAAWRPWWPIRLTDAHWSRFTLPYCR